ncbi:MAG: response regulator transcription factor [Chlorobaculum sp.]|nr:response regulator transcription factor [Chlorobaculum sp.]
MRRKGWGVSIAHSAVDFYRIVEPYFILAIIDIDIDDGSGLALVRYLHSVTKTLIVIISENSSVENKIESYHCGAHLFLTKPVNLQDLGVIVSNMIQCVEDGWESNNKQSDKIFWDNKWRLISESWTLVTPSGKGLRLTGKEYNFISCLAKEPNAMVSRNYLMEKLGHPLNESGKRSLESMVYRLRKKISHTRDTPILTANGSGYTFSAKVDVEN